MAEYTKVHNAWADYPDTSTPITASALDTIEAGIANAVPKDAVTVAGTRLVSTKLLSADTYPAFKAMGDGKLWWGAGGSSDVDTNLYRAAANVLKTDDTLYVVPATSADLSLVTFASGDTYARWTINANGTMSWGAGGATAQDTTLYRAGVGVLKTDGEIDAASVIYSGIGLAANSWAYGTYASGDTYPRLVVLNTGTIQWGGGSGASDTNLYRSAANLLRTDDSFSVVRTGSGEVSYYSTAHSAGYHQDFYVTGEAYARHHVTAVGDHYWGSGAGAVDTNLYRAAANVLKTDDIFAIGSTLNIWPDPFVDMGEISEPANPSANTARVFVKDNGSGKTQLCVRFGSGATQVIATEP